MIDQETQVMIVELRLDGMPEKMVNHYVRAGSIQGAYRLWFGLDGPFTLHDWRQTVLSLYAKNPEFFK